MENKEKVKRALEAVSETLCLMHNELPVPTLNRIFMWIMSEYREAVDHASIIEAEEYLVDATAMAIFIAQGDVEFKDNVEHEVLHGLRMHVTEDIDENKPHVVTAKAIYNLATKDYKYALASLFGLAEYHGIDIATRLIDSCAMMREYIDTHPTLSMLS